MARIALMDSMTLEQEIIARHKNFRAEIARRAALVTQKEDRTYSIPNVPFGVKKVNPMLPKKKPVNHEPYWWHCMWFADLVSQAPRRAAASLTVNKILQAVSNHYQISKREIISQRRTANIVLPRQVAYYLAKTLTGRSLPEIGRMMGGRDHTSILSGIRKIDNLRKVDPKIEADIRQLVSVLGGSLG